MNPERKLEIFEEMINCLCGLPADQCIKMLKSCGVTKEEAEELEFFDFITDQL